MSASLLRRFGLPLLAVVAALTAWLGVHASRVGVEHDNASLRTTDAGELKTYADFKTTFGSDEDILVAIGHPRLLEPDGLTLIADLTREIEAMDGVRRAWSLANAEELVAGETGVEPRALLSPPWDAPHIGERTTAALQRNPDFTGWLVSADCTAAGIVVEIEDRPNDTGYRRHLVAALRELAPRVAASGGELHLTGVPIQKIDVSSYVDRDQRVLLPAAVVVLGITLALFLRHVSGVVVPLAVAGITVVWTLGLYGATGHDLNAITALLPPVLLVVALATTVHVYDAWLHGRAPLPAPDLKTPPAAAGAMDGHERASLAVRAVLVPALLCAVTTAQGFVSLSFSDLPAVRLFGLFAAFGTVVAFVVAVTVVPAALSHLSPPHHRASDEHGWTSRLLNATSGLAIRSPVAVLVVFGIMTAVLAAGIPLLRTNTDLIGFLREGAPLRRDTLWIDRHLGGTLPLDFVISRRDGRPIVDLDRFRRIDALEARIRSLDHVAGVTSVVALVRQVNRAESGGTALALPDHGDRLQGQLDLLDESGHSLVRRFAAPEMTKLRLTVRLRAVGSAVSAPLVAAIRADAARILGPELVLTPTGSLWEVVRDSENLVRQQVTSFGSAIVLVVLAIGLLLRSAAFTLVAMIPNVMPIVWTGGLMGYTGVELSTGTAMIASAVLGLVVDDTIHYLSYYKRVYAGDAAAAIRLTSRAVGAPVTVASTSLVLGFWIGALGSFLPTIYFSLLTGLTMITGVVCDLLVLPASLVLLDRYGRRVHQRHGGVLMVIAAGSIVYAPLRGVAAVGEEPWEVISVKDGVTYSHRDVPGSSFYEFEASVVVHSSLDEVADVVWSNMTDRPPAMISRRILSRSENEVIAYDQIRTPIVRDRDLVLRVRLLRSGDMVEVRFDPTSRPDLPPADGFVRVTDLRGLWRVQPAKPDGVLITYRCYSEPGGMVPAAFIRGAQQDEFEKDISRVLARFRGGAAD